MKRLFALIVFAATFFAVESKAQNVQLFYDAGRNCATSTVEMFRPDAVGSTYFFVDMDYSPKVTGAYWEISREFCFWKDSKLSWLSAHLEYNGGLTNSFSFGNSWLAGATYSGHSKDFSKTWSLSAMYKVIPYLGGARMHNFQITGVWGINFAKGWCSFSGFFDVWSEASTIVFMTEPQFWVNLNQIKGWEKVGLSVGGEVELSANFVGKGFYAMPAVGAKWTF